MEIKQRKRMYESSVLVRGYFTIDLRWLESLKFILNPDLDVFPTFLLLISCSLPPSPDTDAVILDSTDTLQHSNQEVSLSLLKISFSWKWKYHIFTEVM